MFDTLCERNFNGSQLFEFHQTDDQPRLCEITLLSAATA